MSAGRAASPRHIVVVDDEAAAREMVGDYLKLQGFAVTLCDGGRSFRDAFRAQVPDLVLLDLNMTEEDGLSLIRHIRQTSTVPVILLTAAASPIDRVVGLEMGADDYLTKPCELRELLARIRSILRRAPAAQPRAEERRLAAIVSIDQVGFSRSIQHDEPATLATITRVFTEIIEPSLPRHRGTLFKTLGDGALIEFSSVVDAAEWSIAFQHALFDLPRVTAAPPRFRLGIAIGDIVLSGDDRLGETVALAVRVQERGRPGAVTLSDFTHRLVGTRAGTLFHDLGLIELKNIAEPMRLWEWSPLPVTPRPDRPDRT